MQVEGNSRELLPLVRDEVYRIACEALRDSFQHAAASRIEVEIHYDQRQLRMRWPPRLTLGGLLRGYFADQERKPEGMRLERKTVERYRELAAYLSPEITALPLAAVSPPLLNHEWSR